MDKLNTFFSQRQWMTQHRLWVTAAKLNFFDQQIRCKQEHNMKFLFFFCLLNFFLFFPIQELSVILFKSFLKVKRPKYQLFYTDTYQQIDINVLRKYFTGWGAFKIFIFILTWILNTVLIWEKILCVFIVEF